ncbi:MAG: squalene/phytoene synthase family protein [Amphiplicatus sp.]
MNANAEQSFPYCDDLVRRLDEDRWLSARYARPPARRKLIAFYALHLEIERAPAMVSEAALGEIRLQWWREAIDELRKGGPSRAHPVVELARRERILDEASHRLFETAIDARARLLYDEAFHDVDEIERWLRAAEAYLGVAAGAADFAPMLEDAGAAFALARHGRILAPALGEACRARAKTLIDSAAQGLRALPAESAPAALHFALTADYLGGAPSPLLKRWRLFATMLTGRY